MEQGIKKDGLEVRDVKGNLRVHGSMYGLKITGGEVIRTSDDASPDKSETISQVLDELGIGKEDVSLPESLCRMAEKIAELCYEIKLLKEQN